MLQQINLYQPVTTKHEEPFSATVMLILLCITLVLMMGVYGLLYWKKNNLQNEMATLKGQHEQTLMTVEKLETIVNAFTDAKKEQQELKRLKKLYSNKQNALNELSSMVKGNSDGVSDYFSALARKNIEAIWFNNIDVYLGGQQIFLQGQTTDAGYIPQFVASLKEEDVFNGVNFKLFKAQRNEEGNLVYFSLKTEVNQTDSSSTQH